MTIIHRSWLFDHAAFVDELERDAVDQVGLRSLAERVMDDVSPAYLELVRFDPGAWLVQGEGGAEEWLVVAIGPHLRHPLDLTGHVALHALLVASGADHDGARRLLEGASVAGLVSGGRFADLASDVIGQYGGWLASSQCREVRAQLAAYGSAVEQPPEEFFTRAESVLGRAFDRARLHKEAWTAYATWMARLGEAELEGLALRIVVD